MQRTLRHLYPGAVYHVMARGDGGKAIFDDDDDRKAFLFRLGKVRGVRAGGMSSRDVTNRCR